MPIPIWSQLMVIDSDIPDFHSLVNGILSLFPSSNFEKFGLISRN